ncbi:MAG: transglutaminase-like cysteine peptidase [Nitrosomonadales bacterium]|nr:transglutaminase-like cysteine peptidase [Nitrosomonadales bacterium]
MRYAPLAVAGLLLPAVLSAGIADYSSGLLRHVAGKWGEDGQQRVLELQQLVRKQKTPSANPVQPERNRLFPGNTFWNRIPYVNDREHWGKDDYWATPVETAGSNGGDCEDFSIGKYFTLKESGVPLQKLRITYVRARNQAESHMVLAYYPEPDAEPLILDNLVDEILPASKRPDLDPVFSFNDEDVWIEGGTPAKSGSSSHIRLWRELLDKMSREQSL